MRGGGCVHGRRTSLGRLLDLAGSLDNTGVVFHGAALTRHFSWRMGSGLLISACPSCVCVLCASRLVAQCRREGLRRIADDLQIHGQRLADLVEEARNGKDG